MSSILEALRKKRKRDLERNSQNPFDDDLVRSDRGTRPRSRSTRWALGLVLIGVVLGVLAYTPPDSLKGVVTKAAGRMLKLQNLEPLKGMSQSRGTSEEPPVDVPIVIHGPGSSPTPSAQASATPTALAPPVSAPGPLAQSAKEKAAEVDRVQASQAAWVETALEPATAPAPAQAVGTDAAAVGRPEAETPARSPDRGTQEFRLTGILFSEEEPIAIINGQLVKVGDRVSGRRVVSILKDGVRLEGQTELLRIIE